MDYAEIARQVIQNVGGRNNIRSAAPVSYTHLDVYKRQGPPVKSFPSEPPSQRFSAGEIPWLCPPCYEFFSIIP